MSGRKTTEERAASRRRRVLALQVGLLFSLLLCAEAGFRWLAPVDVASVGRRLVANAERYGWGFGPGDEIRVRDPDTGVWYVSRANAHGWRDLERSFAAPPGRFRVVVLGDSNTFGTIVPAEAIYPRVLERTLRAQGYDVEFVTLALGGWFTDQELEALRREGVRYEPDLVVLQFCTNDLSGNVSTEAPPLPAIKPFRYRLAADGRSRREANPDWTPPTRRPWIWWLEGVAKHSELLKRLFWSRSVVRRFPGAERPPLPPRGYRYDASSAARLRLALGDAAERLPAFEFGRLLSEQDLARALAGLDPDQARAARRILEVPPFAFRWTPASWNPEPPDPNSPEWRLLFALLREARDLARAAGADLALVTDCEEGHYRWDRSWFLIGPGPERKANYLAPTRLLREFAAREGIGFVEPRIPHQRARNDPHPNVAGNEAMAENLRRYLMEVYGSRLPRRRDPPKGP